MKNPKKLIAAMIMAGGLEKYNKKTGKWETVDFDPTNLEHQHIKDVHVAEAEIHCVIEKIKNWDMLDLRKTLTSILKSI